MSVTPGRPSTRPPRRRPTIPLMVSPASGLCASPRAFARLCAANPELRLERSASGKVIVMAPAGSGSGMRNAGLSAQLWNWNQAAGEPGVVFDSSAGFTLPNGAIRSPDAAWIARDRWLALPLGDRERFAPICPDFVVELRSRTDDLARLRKKMAAFRKYGARLGWLIDPDTSQVQVYRPDRRVEVMQQPATLSGEDVLPGFVLDLRSILDK